MNLSEVFFQILILLVGAVIGIAVPFLPRPRQKLIAGLLCVFLVIVGFVWGGYELSANPSPQAAASTQAPTPTPPMVINFSAKELMDWCKRFPNAAQAELVAQDLFYGKFVRWSGKISEVNPSLSEGFIAYLIVEDVFVATRFSDRSYVQTLVQGEPIIVTGRISRLCTGVLTLEEGQFSPSR